MELDKFSIKGVVLGTEHCGVLSINYASKAFEWVMTSIGWNNDFILGPKLKKSTKVITEISSLSGYEVLMDFHLKWLSRDSVDILLVDSKGPWSDTDILRVWTDQSGTYKSFGLSRVESIADIERVTALGIKPEWVSITLNPTYFNLELLEYLKKSGIKIIATDVLGGTRMAATNIEVYTLQFLLSFAALYADLVCVSSHSAEEAWTDRNILIRLMDQPVDDEVRALYMFPSSRIVKRSPVKRLPLYQYYLADSGIILDYKGPRDVYLTSLSLNPEAQNIPIEAQCELEEYIQGTCGKLVLPGDCIPGSPECQAFWRYNVIAALMTRKDWKRYNYSYMVTGNLFFITRQKKSALWKKHDPESFVVCYSDLGLVFKRA